MSASPPPPALADYPHHAYEKLRYSDTDRQGHVNNLIFAQALETGRCEVLFPVDGKPLHDSGCDFVIASLKLDFLAELNWPGRIDIGTRVVRVGASSFTLEQGLFQSGRCAATATTVIVQTSRKTRRSLPLNETAIRRLEELRPAVS